MNIVSFSISLFAAIFVDVRSPNFSSHHLRYLCSGVKMGILAFSTQFARSARCVLWENADPRATMPIKRLGKTHRRLKWLKLIRHFLISSRSLWCFLISKRSKLSFLTLHCIFDLWKVKIVNYNLFLFHYITCHLRHFNNNLLFSFTFKLASEQHLRTTNKYSETPPHLNIITNFYKKRYK